MLGSWALLECEFWQEQGADLLSQLADGWPSSWQPDASAAVLCLTDRAGGFKPHPFPAADRGLDSNSDRQIYSHSFFCMYSDNFTLSKLAHRYTTLIIHTDHCSFSTHPPKKSMIVRWDADSMQLTVWREHFTVCLLRVAKGCKTKVVQNMEMVWVCFLQMTNLGQKVSHLEEYSKFMNIRT